MFSEILQKISQAKNIFITSHQNCPDAAGSVLSLSLFLDSLNINRYSFLSAPLPQNLLYLPLSETISSKKPNLSDYDLFLIVDAGDLKQTGIEKELGGIVSRPDEYCVINIDHHKTNESFGHINIVDKNASSTCELIYYFLNENKHIIGKNIADCLLTGIVGDTGNFTNPATNKQCFKIAADLISQGANIFQIIRSILSAEESINTLRLWGTIFERLTYNQKYDIAVSYFLQKDLETCNAREESIEIVANLLNYISGIKAGFLIKETKDGFYKVSMRTTDPNIDLAQLAKMLGGGGHSKAAGFSVGKVSFLAG